MESLRIRKFHAKSSRLMEDNGWKTLKYGQEHSKAAAKIYPISRCTKGSRPPRNSTETRNMMKHETPTGGKSQKD